MKKSVEETTLFGKLLNRVHTARELTAIEAKNELWHRHGLGKPADRVGYKIAETKKMNYDGTEITEYRLYKLIDVARVTVSARIETEIVTGLGEEDSDGETTTD